MIMRIADELEWWMVELGWDGRLMRMQADELLAGVEEERELVVRDYFVHRGGRKVDTVISHLAQMPPAELADVTEVAYQLGLPSQTEELDAPVAPRGYRLLAKIPRIPRGVEENIVKRFGTLQKIVAASMEDLDEVEGVGEARARMIKEGLGRLADTSLADRAS
jgi:diadenylate cyclase